MIKANVREFVKKVILSSILETGSVFVNTGKRASKNCAVTKQ